MNNSTKTTHFYIAYENENTLMLLCVGGIFFFSIAFCAIALMALLTLKQNQMLVAVLLCFVIACPTLFFFRKMNALLLGKSAKIESDDVKFTITANGITTTLYHPSIEDISFSEIKFLWLKRGYDVNIFTSEKRYQYSIVFNGFNNVPPPNETCFADILILVKYARRTVAAEKPVVPQSAPLAEATSAAVFSPEMPTISKQGSVESVLKRLDEELDGAQMPCAEAKPAPTVLPLSENTLSENSLGDSKIAERKSDENKVITYGSFFCENAATFIFKIVAIAVPIIGGLLLFILRDYIVGSNFYPQFNYVGIDAIIIAWAVVWITIFRVGSKGVEHKFTLYDSTVVINSKKDKERVIYLRDLVEMEHRPMRFLWKQYGWKVTLITRYQKITYRVIFPYGRKFFAYDKISLAVLEKYCAKKEKL